MIGMSGVLARRKAIPALLRSTLERFFRGVKPGNPGRPAPRRHNMRFESLEPRMLLSADFLPVAPMGSMVHGSNQSGTVDSAELEPLRSLARFGLLLLPVLPIV